MPLNDYVRVTRRFQRSIKIDSDFGRLDSLEGFVCSPSSVEVLLAVSQQVKETGHMAFTWTGPYGGGKSSLVLVLAALLSPHSELQKAAEKIVGKRVAKKVWSALPTAQSGWSVLPIVGRRIAPHVAIREGLIAHGLLTSDQLSAQTWDEAAAIATLLAVAKEKGGLLLVLDEMGKFLETAAQNDADIYFFQLLAEAASRSNGELLVIGVLHQAFDDYTQRLAFDSRDEWAKVQGRYIDVLVNVAGDEYLELLTNAIEVEGLARPEQAIELARQVGDSRKSSLEVIKTLTKCWPLHPVVAYLLSAISRRRFGQNQRSLFSFLSSAEPHGFQDFLKNHENGGLYSTTDLWNYLRTNLEASILVSPDGHKWATAVEIIEKADAMGVSPHQLTLLKAVALIDLFKDHAGIYPTNDLLKTIVVDDSQNSALAELQSLVKLSFLIFRKHIDSYAIYAGSDFDISEALSEAISEFSDTDFRRLKSQASLSPVIAKKYYHETGVFCFLDVELARLNTLEELACSFNSSNSIVGKLFILMLEANEKYDQAVSICIDILSKCSNNIIIGIAHDSWKIIALAKELAALEDIQDNRRELAGDSIARREVAARITDLKTRLSASFDKILFTAECLRKEKTPQFLSSSSLNALVSTIAAEQFPSSPRISNELLNRAKPSSNAIAALKALLKQMVLHEGKPRVGIDGFPAEGGLCDSVLLKSGLYQKHAEFGWHFAKPVAGADRCNVLPAWDGALSFLENAQDRRVSLVELYSLWSERPFGIKAGLLPLLSVCFILVNRSILAIYRDDVFQSRFTDLDVDYLTADPSSIELRWMDLPDSSRDILYGLASLVQHDASIGSPRPIDVGRGLVAIYEKLAPWVKKTRHLSKNAFIVRDLFKMASDPNKLIFDDIPKLFSTKQEECDVEQALSRVEDGIDELNGAYASMLDGLNKLLLAELGVHNESEQSYKDLRARAKNIVDVGGDFNINSFVNRLVQYSGAQADIEGIASLATSVAMRDWIDVTLEKARVNIAEMAQKFLRAESFARVKGRVDKRHALAVIVGIDGRPTPVRGEFAVTDKERPQIENLIKKLQKTLQSSKDTPRNQILAALAELSAHYLQQDVNGKEDE